jgi:hypothetical protein
MTEFGGQRWVTENSLSMNTQAGAMHTALYLYHMRGMAFDDESILVIKSETEMVLTSQLTFR